MPDPFFSVCIETKNRERTISDAIMSVKYQTFKDFELIIVDNCSTDRTKSEIERFIRLVDLPGRFVPLSHSLEGLQNWNRPLMIAKGRYIAILEGDDRYTPDHLQTAHDIITKSESAIGIYAGTNQITKRNIPSVYRNNVIDGKVVIENIMQMKSVPAPSELIFIRQSPTGLAYQFNTNDYQYCPEIELIIDIASEGYCGYFNDKKTIIRGTSTSKKERNIWKYYRDHFVALERNGNKISENEREQIFTSLAWRMFKECMIKKIRS